MPWEDVDVFFFSVLPSWKGNKREDGSFRRVSLQLKGTLENSSDCGRVQRLAVEDRDNYQTGQKRRGRKSTWLGEVEEAAMSRSAWGTAALMIRGEMLDAWCSQRP